MDLPNQDWQSYLNRDTGAIVTVTDEDRALVEDGADLDELHATETEQSHKGNLAAGLAAGRIQSFEFGQSRLLGTVAVEAVAVSLLWPWLASRGWSFRSIADVPVPMDVARGFGVALLAYIAFYISAVTWAVFVPASYDAMKAAVPTGTAALWTIVLMSVVNPVVEEFVWLGYGVTAMRRYGLHTAVATSIVLRVAVHSYQGIVALTSILPLAIVFTIYFTRTKRLWPVIVAHMLFDAVALLSVLKQ